MIKEPYKCKHLIILHFREHYYKCKSCDRVFTLVETKEYRTNKQILEDEERSEED